jgi:hypothetical protein
MLSGILTGNSAIKIKGRFWHKREKIHNNVITEFSLMEMAEVSRQEHP